jgi:hypothetical protein
MRTRFEKIINYNYRFNDEIENKSKKEPRRKLKITKNKD